MCDELSGNSYREASDALMEIIFRKILVCSRLGALVFTSAEFERCGIRIQKERREPRGGALLEPRVSVSIHSYSNCGAEAPKHGIRLWK